MRELKDVFRAEVILESKALTTEALSLLELGERDTAFVLLDQAIERFPGQPVRYLFAKGMAQLQTGQVERIQGTANEILGYALPPEAGNQRAEKAADYLNGQVLLASGQALEALDLLQKAAEAPGFEYGLYDYGLAQAYLELGLVEEALRSLNEASRTHFERNAVRTEFERDRRLAQLLRIEILEANGRNEKADELRVEYAKTWGGAN